MAQGGLVCMHCKRVDKSKSSSFGASNTGKDGVDLWEDVFEPSDDPINHAKIEEVEDLQFAAVQVRDLDSHRVSGQNTWSRLARRRM